MFLISSNSVTAKGEYVSSMCNGSPLADYSTCTGNGSECYYEVLIGYCISCDTTTCDVNQGVCFLDLNVPIGMNKLDSGIYLVPASASCQDVNDRVCGPLNRGGLLCGQCKPGYGPALYSSTGKCFYCSSEYSASWWWLVYLSLELVPSTVFYLVVILFNVRTTAPPYTAFVFFNQLFALLYKIHPFIRLNLKFKVNTVLLHVVLTMISFWNLDFFRHVIPPFCVSTGLNDMHVVLLECISAFYPLLLVIVTFICIELHARNFRPLVILWMPIHAYFATCRRNMNPKSSIIAAFATFLSLSFSKILFIVLQFTLIAKYNVLGRDDSRLKGLYTSIYGNTTAEYWKQLASTPYLVPLLFVVIVIQLPTLVLLLYPLKAFRRLLACCGSSTYSTTYFFIDTFQGHYKDGTNGSRDFRAASSISFLLRNLFCLVLANYRSRRGLPTQSDYTLMIYILVIASLFYGVVQPCKKKYMNVAECVVYSAAALMLLSFGIGHNYSHPKKVSLSHGGDMYFHYYLSLIFLVLPSLLLLFMVVAKMMVCLCCCRNTLIQKVNMLSYRIIHKNIVNTGDSNVVISNEIPDRLEYPQEYEPIP